MTKISLRVYNREIEAMVENGQLDEAIGHCKHILKTYPMHLETYRLLGKAFLEARRYSDAADIFQRVIMSVPDDFVSHVGMSIISDDEGKLDQATWHMERAFEVQPSNPAIQDELRKLYGRRDGVEPPKVRLTREALANMYTQGALYSQAITEIRAVLANDPNRPDLQVMLARVYSRDGRKSQAIELCTGLLRKYPYCFDALRILLDVMTTTDRLDIIQSYRQRVWALDPYAAYTIGSIFDTDKVADGAVTLDQLSYDPQKLENENHPAWASSLGIKIESDTNQPSSNGEIQNNKIEEKPVIGDTPIQELIDSEETISGNEQIPEWMHSSEMNISIGSMPVSSDPNESELENNEIIEMADIPEWLKDMAPKEDNLFNEQTSEEESKLVMENEGGSIDSPTVIDQSNTTIEEDQFITGNFEGGTPEWLMETRNNDPDQGEEPFLPQPMEVEQEAFSKSNSEQIQEEIEKVDDQTGNDTSFLKDQFQSDSINPNTETETTIDDSQPDSLKDTEPGYLRDQENLNIKPGSELNDSLIFSNDSISEEDQNQSSSDIKPDDDLPDWLKEVGLPPEEEHPLIEEISTGISSELESSTEENEQPDVSEIKTKPDEAELEKTEQESLLEEMPTDDKQTRIGLPSSLERGASFAWLEGLAARQGANPDELLSNPEDRSNEPPEWVRGIIEGKVTIPKNQEQIIQSEDSKTNESLPEDNLSLNKIENINSMNLSGESSQRFDKADKEDRIEKIVSPTDQEAIGLENQEQTINTLDVTQNYETIENEGKKPSDFNHELESTQEKDRNSFPSPEVNVVKDVSDWLKEMEAIEGIGEVTTGISREANLLNNNQTEPLPDWLQDVDNKARASEWISEMENLPELDKGSASSAFITDDKGTEEFKGVTLPDVVGLESHEERVVESETGHFVKPVTSDEWKPLQEVKQVVSSDTGQSSKIELITSGKLPGTGILSKIPGVNVEKESATLEKAQVFIEKDDLKNALFEYGRLIKKGQMLEQVIHDLREITYRYPIEISIWQMLGDALMRGNRLQDALDAYTKAEELLR